MSTRKTTALEAGSASIHLPSLLAFECVARHLNFARAATELEVTPTAISKTVKQLEAQLGVRLFNRTTRSVALSEPGAQLLSTLAPALEQIRHSVTSVSDTFTQPYGNLRINASFVAHASLIEPHLAGFLAQHPNINLEVSLDNRLSDIVAAGFDAGIRLGHALHQDMVAVPIGPVQRRLVVASPSYLAANATPRYPQDLLQHPCIRQRLSTGERFFEWVFQVDEQPITVDVTGRLVFDEMRAVLGAARQGCGFAYVFEQFARSAIETGELIPVLETYSPPSESFYLYYPTRTMTSGKLRVFVEFLRTLGEVG
ncbi:LysR family transcriptional regulator [Pseudomonas sp. NPDC089554]|uniref:LysR family transcriptional regulator n=1 Tax=Pseudomonas sp. NPDC089554 TaxID=3390653 RepID=UPI003CFF6FBB